MKTQMPHEQQGKPSLSNLTPGNWTIIVSGCLFIVSLFLDWTRGVFIYGGFAFMKLKISRASGLPELYLFTLLAAIGCILLCLPFMKRQNTAKYRVIPIIQIILSIVAILSLILLPFELDAWSPPHHVVFGGWLAILTTFGLLIGAILTFTKIRQR